MIEEVHIDLCSWLLANPLFKLRVRRTFLGDKRNERIVIEVEAVDDRLIKACPYGRVARCEFASSVKRDFKPNGVGAQRRAARRFRN